jgi:hypothetical protein
MALSILDDKSKKPNDKILANVLGRSWSVWEEIRQSLKEQCGEVTEIWQYSGDKYGWIMKNVRKKRVILNFTPADKYFMLGFVLGGKAIAVVNKTDLSKPVLDVIKKAPKYGEGTGILLDVKFKKDIPDIKKLIQIKLEN